MAFDCINWVLRKKPTINVANNSHRIVELAGRVE
jgi:hypothetical protein